MPLDLLLPSSGWTPLPLKDRFLAPVVELVPIDQKYPYVPWYTVEPDVWLTTPPYVSVNGNNV